MDWHGKARRARNLLQRQRLAEALELFRELTAETHSVEPQYDSWIEGVALCLGAMGRKRDGAYAWLYLQRFDEALELVGGDQPLLQAYVLAEREEHHAAASRFEAAGKPVAAAIAYERAGDADIETRRDRAVQAYERARDCYLRLLAGRVAGEGAYTEALVLFNLGQCCVKGGDERGQGYLVAAQRRLEEAADGFETVGLRERAFDCYQLLLELGRRSGAFENLAEGYINCIRILKQDNLKYYALQYYEDFLRQALVRREYHAAASLYREAADYCRRSGLMYDLYYLRAAAETWRLAAQKTLDEAGSPDMAENALLAAVGCSSALLDYELVGSLYQQLASLALGERKVERYKKISARYAAVTREAPKKQGLPEHLRQTQAYPEIWHLDLLEWEQAGSVEAVCASVVGDANYPHVVRRRALSLLFSLSEADGQDPWLLARVAESLGDLQIYAVLSPLERLMDHPSAEVQAGVMRALRFLFFKRSFGMLERGLASSDARVRGAAIEALARLHFNHAFDPLRRIFRAADDVAIRVTALESIGRIPSLEAGDFLLQVLREEAEPLRGVARRALSSFENREFFELLRQQAEIERDDVRRDLHDILRRAGGTS